jgi:hypothetical protein
MLAKIGTCLLLAMAVASNAATQQASASASQSSGGFVIRGILVDSLSDQPIGRARVAVAPVNKRDNFTTVITGEDGAFSFAELAPGKYTLTAQARGYLTQAFNQHDQFASSIVVGPDSDSQHLVFRLPPGGAIAGVVTDEAGEPVRDAQVVLYLTGVSAGADVTRTRGRMSTDDQGAYRFAHLSPGHYLVAVDARPWYAQRPIINQPGYAPEHPSSSLLDVAYPVTFYGGATDATAATSLALSPGDRATANISLQPVPALRIKVPADAELGRGARFTLEKAVLDAPPLTVMMQWRTLGTGEQEIYGLAPGHYSMTAITQAGAATPERASSRDINLSSNSEIDRNQEIAYVPVTAKLQFDLGPRPAQAFLQLLNKKTRLPVAERMSDDGAIVFKQGLPPGTYEISINNAPGFYLQRISATGAVVSGRTIEIRAGAPVNLTIAAARGQGQINGIASRDNKPFAGAMIVLVPADPAHNQVLFRRDQTDSDGSFTLPDVVPGAYTLLALEHGWELAWMDPEVLKSYLVRGVAVQVQPNGKYEVKAEVQ